MLSCDGTSEARVSNSNERVLCDLLDRRSKLAALSRRLGRSKAPVIVAKLNRLSRDVRFVPKADILHCRIERRYSITSSAIASTPGGMVRPSALAVFEFMTSSNLVGCSTGRSL